MFRSQIKFQGVLKSKAAQHRMHRTSAGAAHTFRILAPTADSASGGFVRHIVPMVLREIPPLPVTPAVGLTKAI